MSIFLTLLQIAWRNIFRHKRRSLLTMMILVFGSTGLILIGGFFDSLTENYQEEFIHSQTGHLQISAKGFYRKGVSDPFAYLMKDSSVVEQELRTNPHVLDVVPRLKFTGMASAGKNSIPVLVLGVDPKREHKMGSYKHRNSKHSAISVIEGENVDSSDPHGAVLGKGLAEALDLKVGDSVAFITTRKEGFLDGTEYHVRGLFQTIVKDFDDRMMKVDLKSAQKLLGAENEVHILSVILNDTKNTRKVKEELSAHYASEKKLLEIIPWEEQALFYRQTKDYMDKVYNTVQLIITVIFFLSVANTINMALFERMREFGTMMALGNSRRVICLVIFLEVALLSLIGTIAGQLVGSGFSVLVSSIGIEMPPIPTGSTRYEVSILLSPGLLLRVSLISMVSTLGASMIPAYRASHFPIIRALGHF